ncbi:MAG: GntR family transcriptional regulator [Betaproteobacteria bacterium]|nr:GntR family transcriptional regulator [Betaproteobacteria bacterium]
MAAKIRELAARQRLSAADVVYQKIKDEIVMAELEPGALVDEISLAGRFRVSRTPIREALRRLEQDGLVTTIPRRGTLVRRPTLQDIMEIDQIRGLLEPAAARLAAGRVNADALERIAEELLRLRKSKQIDLAEFLAVDWQLHELVLTASGNTHIRDIVNSLHARMSAVRWRSAHPRAELAVGELLELVQALRKGDGDGAEAAMRKHMLATRENRHKLYQLSTDSPGRDSAGSLIAS